MHPHAAPVVAARRLLAVGILCTAWFCLHLANAPAAAAVSVDQAERDAVAIINKHRKSKGLRGVRIDTSLTRAAEWMSIDMARNDYFSHTDRLGRDPFDRIEHFGYPSNDTWRGENLAAGNAGANDTVTQWKESPGHNANMLNGKFKAIGIARVYDASSTYGYYWTTTFGSRVTDVVSTSKPKSSGSFSSARAKFSKGERRKIRKYSRGCKRLVQRRRNLGRKRFRAAYRKHQCGKYIRLGKRLGYLPRR